MPTFYHFAYGSNMNTEDLKRYFEKRGHDPSSVKVVGKAILRDYRLVFNYCSSTRGGGAANIGKKEGKRVEGLLLEMDVKLLEPLRNKEGHPFYYRETDGLTVELENGRKVPPITYIVVPEKRESEHVPPTRHYLDLIISAAREHGLSDDHIEMLEETEVC